MLIKKSREEIDKDLCDHCVITSYHTGHNSVFYRGWIDVESSMIVSNWVLIAVGTCWWSRHGGRRGGGEGGTGHGEGGGGSSPTVSWQPTDRRMNHADQWHKLWFWLILMMTLVLFTKPCNGQIGLKNAFCIPDMAIWQINGGRGLVSGEDGCSLFMWETTMTM